MQRLKKALIYKRQQQAPQLADHVRTRRWAKEQADASLGTQPPWFPPSEFFSAIKDLFIYPLLIIEEWGEMDFQERLEYILHRKGRDVLFAKAKIEFNIRGRVWCAGEYRQPLTHERHVLPGTPLIIRTDETMPERIDIERTDKEDLFFSLTSVEYKHIESFIEFIDPKKKKKE